MKFQYNKFVSKLVKFSGQMDANVKKQLDEFVKQTGQTKTAVYTEMAIQFLRARSLRPEVMSSAERVIREDADLLKRLAK